MNPGTVFANTQAQRSIVAEAEGISAHDDDDVEVDPQAAS